MILSELLRGVTYKKLVGNDKIDVAGLTYDSRTVGEGYCFFAVAGTAVDGHNFIGKALEAGAKAVICQHIPAEVAECDCTFVVVDDTNNTMGTIASNYYGNPSHELKVVGVTGTNGKTTIATLLYDLVQSMGYKAGLISTVVYKVGAKEIVSTHTTPDAIRLNAMMREMVDAGCEYCFMECSSHAIVQQRIGGLRFVGGLFTNITLEHLDYHKTFAEYIRAKKSFFDALPKSAFALVNADDRNGEVMLQNTKASRHTLSLQRMADFRAKVIEMMVEGMELRIDNKEVWVQFLGRFNAYNLLTVYGAAVLLGFEREELPILEAAYRRGMTPATPDEVKTFGDVNSLILGDFERVVERRSLQFSGDGKSPAKKLFSRIAGALLRTKPVVKKDECVGCGVCRDVCPAKTIVIKGKLAKIKRRDCIRCFCCQEFCPKSAMKVHRSFIAELFHHEKKKK